MVGTLIWGEHPSEKRQVTNEDELERVLDELTKIAESNSPFTLLLRVNSDTGLQIIIGLKISTVLFYSANSHPQNVGNIGSLEFVNDDEWISFNHRGELSEVPKKQFISSKDARQALINYFITGQRPNNIVWRELY